MSNDVKYEGAALEAIKQVLPEVDFSKIEGDVTLAAINEQKSARLVTVDVKQREIDQAIGRITGEGQTVFGRILGDDAKDKKYKDLLPIMEQRWKDSQDRIALLEKDGAAGLSEQDKKDLSELRKLATEQKTKIEDLEKNLEEAGKTAETKLAELQLNSELDKLFDSVTWIDDVNPYAKKGLRDEIFSKNKFRREGDKILVFDNEGNIVKDKTGQMEAKILFEDQAKAAKLFKLNGAKSPESGKTPIVGPEGKELTPQQKKRIAEIEAEAERKRKLREV